MIYLILALLCILGMLLWDGSPQRRGGSAAFGILCLLFALVAGLRYRVGADTLHYEYILSAIPPLYDFDLSTFSGVRFSPGIIIITGISRMFTPWIWPVQLTAALWINFTCFRFGSQHVKRRFLFAGLYLLCSWININFEVMREGIALGFFLTAWPSFEKHRWLRYYILILCAIFFHYAASLLLLLPLLSQPGAVRFFKSTRCVCILLAGALTIGLFFPFDEISLTLASSSSLPTYFKHRIFSYYIEYLQPDNRLNFAGIAGYLIKFAAYPMASLLILRRHSMPVVVGLFFLLVGIQTEPLRRLSGYFSIFLITITVNLVDEKRSKMPLWLWISAFIPLILFTALGYTGRRHMRDGSEAPGWCVYYPYCSWISPRIDPLREKFLEEAAEIPDSSGIEYYNFNSKNIHYFKKDDGRP